MDLKGEHRAKILKQLDQPVSDAIVKMVDHLAKDKGVLAVLFYGNRLRVRDDKGLLDVYVLTDGNAAYHGYGFSAFFNKLLPPNVYFKEVQDDEETIQAKVAVMSLSAFARKMELSSLDTTLWARFSQSSALVFCRDQKTKQKIRTAIETAYETALWWAAHLTPSGSSVHGLWTGLYSKTYGAELRVESGARAITIIENAPELYEDLFQLFVEKTKKQPIPKNDIEKAKRRWARRRIVGKLLNFMRLLKAAATFRGGIAYALSKVERHSGSPVELSPWERRFPRLAAPVVFCRLLIKRRLR